MYCRNMCALQDSHCTMSSDVVYSSTRLCLLYFLCVHPDFHGQNNPSQFLLQPRQYKAMIFVYRKGDIVKQPMKKGSFVPKNVPGVGWVGHEGVGWMGHEAVGWGGVVCVM